MSEKNSKGKECNLTRRTFSMVDKRKKDEKKFQESLATGKTQVVMFVQEKRFVFPHAGSQVSRTCLTSRGNLRHIFKGFFGFF